MLEVLIEEIIDFLINILTCLKDMKVKSNLFVKCSTKNHLPGIYTFDSINAGDKNHR